jgi:glycerol-3-phosphate acyltransferase PlsX
MGGDTSAALLFSGVLEAAKKLAGRPVSLVAYAIKDQLPELIRMRDQALVSEGLVSFHEAEEEITMEDTPVQAIRRKKNSSMLLGLQDLAQEKLQAFISTGNTGALVGGSILLLGKLPNIHRPALMALLPTPGGGTAVLDVGGIVEPKVEYLVQYAKMGAAYQQCRLGISEPIVGLLNIGTESKKGTGPAREAYQLLEQACAESVSPKMSFKGNVEGKELFTGVVHVLVTDGFTGNVFLKTIEGVSSCILDQLKNMFELGGGLLFEWLFSKFTKLISYDEYPGALVAGVDRIVIKCHGYSSPKAMSSAVLGAANLVEKDLIAQLHKSLSKSL